MAGVVPLAGLFTCTLSIETTGTTTALRIVAVPSAMLIGVPDGFAFESIRENCLVGSGVNAPKSVIGTVTVDWPGSKVRTPWAAR